MYYEDELSASGLCTPPIEYGSTGEDHFRYNLPLGIHEDMLGVYGREESLDLEDLQFECTSYNGHGSASYGRHRVPDPPSFSVRPSQPSGFQQPSDDPFGLIAVDAEALTTGDHGFSDLPPSDSSFAYDPSLIGFSGSIDDAQVVPTSPARTRDDGPNYPCGDERSGSTTFSEYYASENPRHPRECVPFGSSSVRPQHRRRQPRLSLKITKERYQHI